MVQALVIDGVSYDIGVKLCGTNRLFLLEKHFEDVKAPGLLRQAAEAKVGCPGCLEDEEEGITWSSRYPLEKKGCYIFFPHKEDSEFYFHPCAQYAAIVCPEASSRQLLSF